MLGDRNQFDMVVDHTPTVGPGRKRVIQGFLDQSSRIELADFAFLQESRLGMHAP